MTTPGAWRYDPTIIENESGDPIAAMVKSASGKWVDFEEARKCLSEALSELEERRTGCANLVRAMGHGQFGMTTKAAYVEAVARIEYAIQSREALEAIAQYGSDTLSGRADGPDDRAWQRDAVKEMTRRARAALAKIPTLPAVGTTEASLNAGEASGPVGLGPIESGLKDLTIRPAGVERTVDVHGPGPELGPHDALPCDVTCDGFGTFRKGIKLGTLLGYLARRVTYNNAEPTSNSSFNDERK